MTVEKAAEQIKNCIEAYQHHKSYSVDVEAMAVAWAALKLVREIGDMMGVDLGVNVQYEQEGDHDIQA